LYELRLHKNKKEEKNEDFPKPSYFPPSVDKCQNCGNFNYLVGWKKEDLKCISCVKAMKKIQVE